MHLFFIFLGIVSLKGFEAIMPCHVESTVFQSGSGIGRRSELMRNEKSCSGECEAPKPHPLQLLQIDFCI